MSDEQKSKVETIEDAFEKTLADMMSARDELETASQENPSLDVVQNVESPPEKTETEVSSTPSEIAPEPSISTTSESLLSPPLGPPMGAPPGPPMMGPPPGPPMGAPPGPPMMGPPPGPPMMGPPPGPPMGAPPGPPMMGPPSGPPMMDSPSPPLTPEIIPVTTDEEAPAPVVADLSALVGDSPAQEVPVAEAPISEPEPSAPKFIPVDADDFMSEFEDEWDESAPVRISDIDDTEDMDW